MCTHSEVMIFYLENVQKNSVLVVEEPLTNSDFSGSKYFYVTQNILKKLFYIDQLQINKDLQLQLVEIAKWST